MKKNKLNLIVFCSILSIGILSCKKQVQPSTEPSSVDNVPQLNETTRQKFFEGKEINFTPKDNETIILMTKRFVSQTAFKNMSLKSSIYDMQDPDINAGAWLFEAASNYLENSNNVVSEDDEVNFTLTIDKLSTGEMDGTDLVAKFNAFISNLESYRASEGYKPKVIDVRIGIDNPQVIQLLANVSFGVEVTNPAYAFPNYDVTYMDAANIYLTNSVSHAARQLNSTYIQVGGNSTSTVPGGIFLSSVVSYTTYMYFDVNNNYFYIGTGSSTYSFSLFQDEHDRIYTKLLNYCSQNSIPATSLWHVSITPAFTSGIPSYNVHQLSQIKTADVNVM